MRSNETVIIRNKEQLAINPLRRKALEIIETGISRVLPGPIMESALSYDQSSRTLIVNGDSYILNGRLFVIGGGKAAGLMAQTLERIIGPGVITDGLIIEKASPQEFGTTSIRIMQAGHPIPDERGVAAVRELLALKSGYSIGKDDLVLCLISGGGSALMPGPAEGISLADKQVVTRLLLSSGADIGEINAVRKHLSRTKGGRLAEYFAPAKVISLILSDVVGNDLSVIASGPAFSDPSTFKDAIAVLKKYSLSRKIPAAVERIFDKGCRGEIPETPKYLDNVRNYIIGDVRIALEAMADKARRMGFNPLIISSEQIGDTCAVAAQRAREIKNGDYQGYDALLMGGETTPTLPAEHGLGGRNQHYATCTLAEFGEYTGEWVMASLGTDGSDFMPDIAGAIVDNRALHAVQTRNIDLQSFIINYDSNHLLDLFGNSLVKTGNTGTNVGDIVLYLLSG